MRDLVSLLFLVRSVQIGRFVVRGWLEFCVGGDGKDVLVCDRAGPGVDLGEAEVCRVGPGGGHEKLAVFCLQVEAGG